MSSAHWCEALHEMLDSSDTADKEIIEFIDETVPDGESRLYDNKRQVYIHSDSTDTGKERKFNFLKHISALANTRDEQRFRYLFACFDDDGQFIGASDWNAKGGDHAADLDEARVQNVFSDSLEPIPKVKRHILENDGDRAVVFEIQRAESPPILFDQSISIEGGSKTLVKPGMGYIRKGSQSRRMTNADYRVIVERRETVINETIEETLKGLNQIVGIPSNDLENLDLTVSSSGEGVPIDELVTTEGYSDLNKRLSLSVKEWNTSGELYSNRDAIYTMLKRRDELQLDDEHCEFLMWSTLNNHFPPTEWILNYESDPQEPLHEFYRQKLNGRIISVFEATNYILGCEEVLSAIAEDDDITYLSSKAEEYLENIGKSPEKKLMEVTSRKNVSIAESIFSLKEFVNSGGPLETGLEQTVDALMKNDESNNRSILRDIEYARLAREVYLG